jgi:hypothetical protein
MRSKTCLAVALVLLLSLALAPQISACTNYNNSRAFEGDLPDGPYCGSTGPGCSECTNLNPSTGAYRICYSTYNDPWNLYCFYYGNPPENQQI